MTKRIITAIVSWETRNHKKSKKVQVLLTNYGLKKIHKNMFIGKLKVKEKNYISDSFKIYFDKKTDTTNIVTLCDSCHNNLASLVKNLAKSLPDFEIITVK